MEELEKIHLELSNAHEKCQDHLFKEIYENNDMSWVDKLNKVIDLRIYRNNVSYNIKIDISTVFNEICPEALPDPSLDISIEIVGNDLGIFDQCEQFPDDAGSFIDIEEFQSIIRAKTKLYIHWEEYNDDYDCEDDDDGCCEYIEHDYELEPDDIAKFAMIIVKKHKSMRFIALD